MEKIIEIQNLKKSFKDIHAVNDINFYVEKGKLFSFLGTNGAGKSTTINILCTLLEKDTGTVLIDHCTLGKDNNEIRSKIGVVFQDNALDPLLSVKENILTRGKLYNLKGKELMDSLEFVINATDIGEFVNRPYGKLSGGQKRRVDIARALIHKPSILFLDEPTTGLDPSTRELVWNTIANLQKEYQMTIFLTTHYMEEAATSDYIVIINHGQIVAQGTPYDLKEKFSQDALRLKPLDDIKVKNILDKSDYSYMIKNDLIISTIKESKSVITLLQELEPFIESFEVIHGSMNDAFIEITKGELNND
ncbi:ABC transporter ATP-binding protein [Anaerorhabdus furcosa]|uniref:Multidrug/hemolysin transport system ATP-binding protein n=1 Tax=Anaerorhabdus furcosa TaxID=118967 RepID=A0A1T4NZ42_9FIRM|nr:ABC transporter ATP-binding protein [Anaerorhabdus furcosa]SJZ84372.1 multidrug/hemolysin transport system ATP-binding protein [Anaerorhabdus furcosa]